MTLTAILLLIVAAVLHGSWNVLSKHSKPSAAFLLIANSAGCLLLAPLAIAWNAQYTIFPDRVWILVTATGVFQALYYASLAGAYRSGDVSLAYPLARSSPVIVVATVTFLMGQGDAISRQCIAGILLVVAGCFLVPMNHFRDLRLKNYLCRTCGLALLAAVGTAGYSIIDAEALGSIRPHLGSKDSLIVITILYAFVEAVSAGVFLLLYVSLNGTERKQLTHVLCRQKLRAAVAGLGIYLTYVLVLISMSMVRNVSYVVGFRQLSIPIGVVMGVILLKEPMAKPKALGVAVLVTGLILIAMG